MNIGILKYAEYSERIKTMKMCKTVKFTTAAREISFSEQMKSMVSNKGQKVSIFIFYGVGMLYTVHSLIGNYKLYRTYPTVQVNEYDDSSKSSTI